MAHLSIFICMYYLFSYLLTYYINILRRYTSSKLLFLAEMGNCFYRAVGRWKDEISDEKYKEIPRSSYGLFEKNPQVFVPPLFSSNFLEEKSKITEIPAETVDMYSVVHGSSICTYSSLQKKGFSFQPIIIAGSFSLITTQKQCKSAIT